MANTQTASDLVVTKFLADFFREYVRNQRFAKETGTSSNNVTVIKEGRQTINVPLVTRLKGNGVSGSSTLRGNGENIGNYSLNLTPTYYRHAVEFDREEMEKPNIDLMGAARPLLMDWAMELTRDHIIEALGAVHNGTSYLNYGDATAANHNSWAVNNSDRVLYGAATSNYSGVHATDLAKLDSTADEFVSASVSLMKRLAKNADPHVRPIRINGDEEWYICYCDSYTFRDFKTDMKQNLRDGMPRGRNNPLFRDNDLVYDGVIVREIPEIAKFIDDAEGSDWSALATAGDSSDRVSPVFLCGAQAIGFGLGQRPRVIVDRDYDYGFQPGVAVECKHDIDKAFYDTHASGSSSTHKQHGMVTGFFNAVLD